MRNHGGAISLMSPIDLQEGVASLSRGAYFIGEVLDLDGPIGGYNFQWAWSSGYLAGISAGA